MAARDNTGYGKKLVMEGEMHIVNAYFSDSANDNNEKNLKMVKHQTEGLFTNN